MNRGPVILSSFLAIGLAGSLYLSFRTKTVIPQSDLPEPASSRFGVSSKPETKQVSKKEKSEPRDSLPVTAQGKSLNPIEKVEADFRSHHAQSVAAQLATDLNSLMANNGFTQAEIDVAARTVGNAFLNPVEGVVKLSRAIDSVAGTLRLNKERAKDLENAVFTAVGNSTGRYSFSEYQACVQLRTASASSCVKEIADELTQKVGASAEGDIVDAKAIAALKPEAATAAKRAVEECGEKPDSAGIYLNANLEGCL